jgi:putative transposase
VSERRGCRALRVWRPSHRCRSTAPNQAPLRMRIKEIAAARVRYGYFRIYNLLRREGWSVNHRRVYRIYRQEGLSMRIKRPRRHVSAAYREGRVQPGRANDS